MPALYSNCIMKTKLQNGSLRNKKNSCSYFRITSLLVSSTTDPSCFVSINL